MFVLIIWLLSFFVVGCEKTQYISFPKSVEGRWITDNPKYQDRFIELDENAITIGTGGNNTNLFYINKIQRIAKKPIDEWVFLCQDNEGDPFEFVMYYDVRLKGSLLTLRNMEKISWYKIQE